MVLYKSNSENFKIDRLSKKISRILHGRENIWNEEQEEKMRERLDLKLTKAKKAKDYTKRLLQDCKSWNGLCTTVDELHEVLRGKDNQLMILKTEMAYYAHTHKAEKIARKDLFKINNISFEEMLENFSILLDEEDNLSLSTVANLLTNEDMLKSLSNDVDTESTCKSNAIGINDLCVVVWQSADNKYDWYLGYVKSYIDGESYVIDHLQRVLPGSHHQWMYPKREDIQTVELDQIIPFDVIGQWIFSPDYRKRFYTLENYKDISGAFKQFIG